ncbi:MAG: PIN domain-containing protein [Deltaproteobacteria bacterium]|nr:PIN domain-containing protein [Deltaproteobacteria bacterium]
MRVLVDTSVWINYFGGGAKSSPLDRLIDDDLIVTNEIILAELLPLLIVKRQKRLVGLLKKVALASLSVDWNEIIDFQTHCIKSGINGIGIPDLIIAQNAKQGHCAIYSLDKHFEMIKEIAGIKIFTDVKSAYRL